MMMKTQLKHLLLCYWRKKDIGYFNKSFVEPEMTPDPHEILTPYQYFKLFITDKMLGQPIPYPKPWQNLETAIFWARTGEVYRMPNTYGSC